jgi:multiple sugar transport system substrate-binding protein
MTMKTRHDTRRGANTAAGQALSRRRLLQMGATAGGLAATVPLLSACGGSSTQSGSSGSTSSKTGTLLAWTYFDQAKIAASQFMKSHPGIKVNMQVFPGNNYETKLRLALSTDQSPPDLFDMDADYLGKYINTFPEDLTSYGVDNLVSGYVPYVRALGQDSNGHIRGVTDNSSPAGFFYRRSLARKYLGITSPDELSAKLTQWSDIIPLGKEVLSRSGGKVHIIADYSIIIQDVRHQMDPWVVNGKFTIDPRWNQALDVARTVYDQGIDAKLAAFSAPWGAAWNNGTVVMFGWPSWQVININPKQTGNDWGVAKGPSPEYEGGRYTFIYKNSPNKRLAYKYLEFIASSQWQNYNLQHTMNMPGLKSVFDQNRATYKPALFGGQPILEVYEPIAMGIPARPDNPGSESVQALFYTAVDDGFRAHQSNAQIFASLKSAVKDQLPTIKF